MIIDKNSYGTLAFVYIISAVLILCFDIAIASPFIKFPLIAFIFIICIWQTFFFRVPSREAAGDSILVNSVADGKVVILGNEYEKEFLKKDCIKVSVYMNFFDVHANFWPVSGEIVYYKYYPGKHFLAFQPKASEENEHTCVCIRTDSGKEVFFKQLAGTFARRIVCHAKVGDTVTAGGQCGIIKFGSRIDMFLPADSNMLVNLGDKTKACKTLIAEL